MIMQDIFIPQEFECLNDPQYQYYVFHGGRGGAKSHSIARHLLLSAAVEKMRVLCAREFQASIKDSVKTLLDDIINKYSVLGANYRSIRDEIFCRSGSNFIFKGMKINPENAKSIEGVKYTWIEEGQTSTRDSWETLKNTVIREPGAKIIISANFKTEDDVLYKDFIASTAYAGIAKVVKINYCDNPFLPEALRREAEICKYTDYDRYRHIWLGETLKISDAVVFKGRYKVRNFDTPDSVRFYFGADFGFGSDPSVLIRFFVDDEAKRIYIDREAYGHGLDLSDNSETGLPAVFGAIPESKKWPIVADSSRPECIKFLKDHGFRIEGAKKGKGSIEDGVMFLRGYEIIIHEDNCPNMAYEAGAYSYKTDKDGTPLPIILDKDNHCWDAVRYGAEKLRKSKVVIV